MAAEFARDVGELHATLFDHSNRCEKEIKFVVRELEVRRNDREATSLNKSIDLVSKIDTDHTVVLTQQLQEKLPLIQTQLTAAIAATDNVKAVLGKVEAQRETDRKRRDAERELLRQRVTQDMAARRAAVDKETEDNLRRAQEQYAVPESAAPDSQAGDEVDASTAPPPAAASSDVPAPGAEAPAT